LPGSGFVFILVALFRKEGHAMLTPLHFGARYRFRLVNDEPLSQPEAHAVAKWLDLRNDIGVNANAPTESDRQEDVVLYQIKPLDPETEKVLPKVAEGWYMMTPPHSEEILAHHLNPNYDPEKFTTMAELSSISERVRRLYASVNPVEDKDKTGISVTENLREVSIRREPNKSLAIINYFA
jgi:hypothetical protein